MVYFHEQWEEIKDLRFGDRVSRRPSKLEAVTACVLIFVIPVFLDFAVDKKIGTLTYVATGVGLYGFYKVMRR